MNTNYSRDLQFDVLVPDMKAMSRKQVLLKFSKQAAKHLNISEKILFDMLLDKETVASSGTGDGVAFPHLQIRGTRKPFAMLATLSQDIDFDAVDRQPVNIVCMLISPVNEGPNHLRRLSRLSRLLTNETLKKRLGEAHDEESMRALLIDPEGWLMAA